MNPPIAASRQPGFPRYFIDLTTLLYFVGQPPIGITRTEREIAKRLLSDPRLTSIPVAFLSHQMFILEQEHVNLILQDCPPTSPAYRPPLPANEPPHVRSAGLLNRLKKSIRAVARGLVRLAPAYSREDLRWTLFFALRFLRAIRIRAANPSFESSSKERTPDVSAPDHVRNRIHAQLAVVARPCARDVFWTCGHLLPLRWVAEQKRLDQFRVVAMGYDVIRARYPEWNPPDAPRDL